MSTVIANAFCEAMTTYTAPVTWKDANNKKTKWTNVYSTVYEKCTGIFCYSIIAMELNIKKNWQTPLSSWQYMYLNFRILDAPFQLTRAAWSQRRIVMKKNDDTLNTILGIFGEKKNVMLCPPIENDEWK